MTEEEEHFWDFLSEREAVFMQKIMDELGNAQWAHPILEHIAANGGLTRHHKSLLFELRFGHAVHQQGIALSYESPGEAQSTLEFGFVCDGQTWRVELMRLEETQAAQEATQITEDEGGMKWFRRTLSASAADRRQSEEGETLKAVQRICQKCESNGQPHKFPMPDDGALHALLVDFRTFLHGGDVHDRIHVGLGGEFLTKNLFRRFWDGALISGVFNKRTKVRGAEHIRERLHFLGFVNEKEFGDGSFAKATEFVANPYLFASEADAKAALDSWPLKPPFLINA